MPVNVMERKRGFADVIKITKQLTLKQGDYPGLFRWTKDPRKGDKRKAEEEEKVIQTMRRT